MITDLPAMCSGDYVQQFMAGECHFGCTPACKNTWDTFKDQCNVTADTPWMPDGLSYESLDQFFNC